MVNSLPGASKQTVKDDGEGTIEQDGDKGRNAGKIAEIAIPTGGTVGSIGGLGSGHRSPEASPASAPELAAAGLVSLFTRGADVNIETGTQVEMVLQRPLILEEANLSRYGSAGTRSGSGSLRQSAQAARKTQTCPRPLPARGPRMRVIWKRDANRSRQLQNTPPEAAEPLPPSAHLRRPAPNRRTPPTASAYGSATCSSPPLPRS